MSTAADTLATAIFFGKRAGDVKKQETALTKTTKTLQASTSLARLTNDKTVHNLEKIAGKVSGVATEEATNFLSKGLNAAKGFGLGANILYIGAKTVEQEGIENKLKVGAAGAAGLGCMYKAENLTGKGIAKAAAALKNINPNEVKGVTKLLATAAQKMPGGRLGTVIKTVASAAAFVGASFAGSYLGTKAGEAIVGKPDEVQLC